jgi:hypothetical protein
MSAARSVSAGNELEKYAGKWKNFSTNSSFDAKTQRASESESESCPINLVFDRRRQQSDVVLCIMCWDNNALACMLTSAVQVQSTSCSQCVVSVMV